jgi:AmmeMemoRadiSam system radical SAM enzyme/AmmeMemoRadiSam system protein B/AmmeMemoRadiSam system protein A
MPRRVESPPDIPADVRGLKAGGWWHESPSDSSRLVCDLCPRECSLAPGDRGFCFVRQNDEGRIVSTTYGRSTGFCIDPIEKKPLNHFYPGTATLSFGTAGCNLGCKFCQNWSSSKSRQVEIASAVAAPDDIARTAKNLGCRSVAFTYNDPIIWAEYAIDTAKACHALGVQTVAVTSGYIGSTARKPFFDAMDAANVDLKGFTEDFYWKMTSGHLQPVCDTLRWLVHESRVWVEITNLVIPAANDSPEQIEAMCRWIVKELNPDVPLHFTAFHPDFRLQDRGPTPPETLAMAHDIARGAGLRYVYTGNIADRERQSTYCPRCGRVVVERDGYELGEYAIRQGQCRHCGQPIAGRFDDAPGQWGPRRQPVQILPEKTTMATDSSRPDPVRRVVPDRPSLTREQEDMVFRAAASRVAAAVRSQPAQRLDELLRDVAGLPVFGVFVSLKSAGQLRSCCGYLGQSIPLHEALDHAAVRAAKEDPRFPPISPGELKILDMEVWLLWGMEPVAAKGDDRIEAIVIGKHGLQIARGPNRGLLLPSVAVDHHLDAEGFLRQVCLKAGLPIDAWKSDETQLATFEGYAIHGPLAASLANLPEPAGALGPTAADVGMLAEFCRGNLLAMLYRATPSCYLPGGYDGNVHGLILSVYLPGRAESLDCSKLLLPPADMPLQATLLEMVESLSNVLRAMPLDAAAIQQMRCALTILWDPSPHGAFGSPEIDGLATKHRAVIAVERGRWALAFNAAQSPAELLSEAIRLGRFLPTSQGSVFSMAVVSTGTRIMATNVPTPQTGPRVRSPAVAGRFYPSNLAELNRTLDEFLPVHPSPEPWAAAMIPHAGWIYSGRLAAQTLSRVAFPSHAIVVCPKHQPAGSEWAVAPHRTWALPGREVLSDPDMAKQMAEAVPGFALDFEAHRAEHAIEVQLPIMARLAPEIRVVGAAMHGGEWLQIQRAAEAFAQWLGQLPERPFLVISTDMNHYADDAQTRRLDRMALDAVESLDPEKLLKTVRDNRISMCGVLPAVFVLETLRQLGVLKRCESVGYATSGDASGDFGRVVGYAGMLFGA